MIWAKRLLAVVVAAGLIVAAVVIRNEVIDGDDPDSADPDPATTLVCLSELAGICDAVRAGRLGIGVRVETAAATTRAWTADDQRPDEVWLTVAPLPDLVAAERQRLRLDPLDLGADTVGASQLVVAVPNAKADALATECDAGGDLDWRCIGNLTGTPWSDLGGPPGSSVRPAFAPLDTAVGQLGVTQAVLGYFANAPIDAGDPGLITWARRLARAVAASALSGGTPVATVQVRDSALDVAVGFDAEIANARRDRLTVLYAAPMTRVDLVLATPRGVTAPGAVVAAIERAAADAGWTANVPGTPLTADQVAQAVSVWSQNS